VTDWTQNRQHLRRWRWRWIAANFRTRQGMVGLERFENRADTGRPVRLPRQL